MEFSSTFAHIPTSLAELSTRPLPDAAARLVAGARQFRIVAMGGSYNAACAAVEYFLGLGIDARAELASHLVHSSSRTVSSDEVVVLVSYSGTSIETIRAAETLRATGHGRVICITNEPTSPLALLCDVVIDQRLTEETHVPYGPFATTYTTLCKLAAAADGTAPPDFSSAGPAAAAALDSLDSITALHPAAPAYAEFFGRGAYAATAVQATLITREIARVPAAGWESSTYRHGPIEAISPRQLSVVFAARDGGAARLDASFARALRAITPDVLVVGPDDADVPLATDDTVGPLVALTVVAILAYHWGETAGIPAGQFRYTSHSITDEDDLHVG
ncbi:SIS domain-containing protein [Actinoallomurus soli]|uniref:SIS domain-containing protein n=1 Tax=Actinoallomurus soli TaxID=2952535 RepID=UPI00209395F3|nr:SIS domain-containing protein [Actinoallomurus soli]MCO5969411.1 SIS domain-containing protein [Actinoallomurus soli]